MARTKREVDREQKRKEIVSVAGSLFLQGGYEATTITRIAEQMNVAPNTLYWYFADKDALLIAVLDELINESLREYERRRRSSLESQLLWLLELFSVTRGLIASVHARVEVSESVRDWHDGSHRMFEAVIEEQLRSRGLARGHEAHAAKATMFLIEGIHEHRLSSKEVRSLIRWLVSLVKPKRATA